MTERGRILMRDSAAPRIKRATAERALAEFGQRIVQVNEDPGYLCFVKKAVVFGSFLSKQKELVMLMSR
jgi:hypothetical protein